MAPRAPEDDPRIQELVVDEPTLDETPSDDARAE
jgi:hypothetical protein